MAGSRLERLGTIFGRVTALLRSDAMKREDRPKWYDVYQAFPPLVEPTFGRHVEKQNIRTIFYPEDTIRSKFHKKMQYKLPPENLVKGSTSNITQRVVDLVKEKIHENKLLTEDAAVDQVIELLKSEGAFYVSRVQRFPKRKIENMIDTKAIIEDTDTITLVKDYEEAVKNISSQNINVKDLLKDK